MPKQTRATAPEPIIAEAFVETPIGQLRVVAENDAVTEIAWTIRENAKTPRVKAAVEHPLLQKAITEIEAYFAGTQKNFSFAIAPRGTEFQRCVWNRMREIAFGETLSYGALARILDSGPRAIGQACGKNPVLLVVPCHRVVAQQGLGGFGGKVQKPDQKTLLLNHEQRHRDSNQSMTGKTAKDNFARQQNPAA